MKILILNWKDIKNPDVGGAEIILYELAKRMVKDGHDVTWFTRKFHNCSEFESIGGIKIIRKGGKLSVYFEAFKYYHGLSQKPDKVIESVNTLLWQTPFYVPGDKRIVFVNQLAKEVFFYELPNPFGFLAYILEKWEYQSYRSSKFICYSQSVAKDLKTFSIPAHNISHFMLGVDHSRYQKGEKSLRPLFIFVARLARMKRADLCVKAMKYVVENHPDAQLLIVGYGPEEYNLKMLIEDLNLSQNVSIVGKNNLFFQKNVKDIKVKLMQKAWALLLPSVKEGWGMVVTEAAACGTPSIVTNVSGLQDAVIPVKTGIIVSANPKVEELAVAMKKIIEDAQLRRHLSEGAFQFAQKFNWDQSYKKYMDLLE